MFYLLFHKTNDKSSVVEIAMNARLASTVINDQAEQNRKEEAKLSVRSLRSFANKVCLFNVNVSFGYKLYGKAIRIINYLKLTTTAMGKISHFFLLLFAAFEFNAFPYTTIYLSGQQSTIHQSIQLFHSMPGNRFNLQCTHLK